MSWTLPKPVSVPAEGSHQESAGVMTIAWASATAVMTLVQSAVFVKRRNPPAVAKGFVTEQPLQVAPAVQTVFSLAHAARM